MRTTVEIKPEHRSALLSLASRRGEKGFSSVLEEAIDSYLRHEDEREKRRSILLSLSGAISPREAERLKHAVSELRENWR